MTPSPRLTHAHVDPHVRPTIRGRDPTASDPATSRSRMLGTAVVSVAALVLALGGGPARAAEPPVGLGTARSFAVLGGTTVTNTGPSVISGDVGVSPGTAVTGFSSVAVTNGTIHRADAVALQAQSDTTLAYDDAARRTTSGTITADLADQRLSPGVYTGPTLALNGTLTLDAHGDPNAVFVFQAGSTLKTGSSSTVLLVNGADPCNVFWQVGSSATLGTTTTFVGTILALTSITANTHASVVGRLLARHGAVTLDSNTITSTECSTTGTGSTGGGSGTTTSGNSSGSTGASTSGSTSGGTGATTGGTSTGSTGATTGGSGTATAGDTGTSGSSTGGGGDTSTGPGTGSHATGAGSTSGSATVADSAKSNAPANAAARRTQASGLPFTGAPLSLLLLIGVIATVLGVAGLRAGRRRLPARAGSGEHGTSATV